MRYVYTALFYLMLPFIFLRLLWRSRHMPGNRKGWAERLGYCPFRLEKSIWVHAVSVGETLAAMPLIKAILQEYPDLPLVVTNMTATGAARVKAALKDSVKQVFIPYDLPGAVNRFLQRINPCVALVMETELWPNLFAKCREKKIPIIILNARLSEQSAQGYARIPSLRRDLFSSIHSLAAAGSADAQRFIQLGLSPDKVTVTGNLKFDLELPANLADKSEVLRNQIGKERLIWIAASTHPGEEEMILAAHRAVLKNYPNALLLLVPRHPDRFPMVAELVKQQGYQFVLRSSGDACSTQTQVYLGDTMGEMLLFYSVCDVAFVAGSFADVGGHNILEPAALHKPIITGPVLYNFMEISQMLMKAKGMVVVNNVDELAAQVEHFFADKEERLRMGENAYQVVSANRGALQKQIQLIRTVINSNRQAEHTR